MLIDFFNSIVLVFIFICISVNSESNIRNYVVRQDFLASVKKHEYDIFDQTENHLHYYIEGKRFMKEIIEVIAAPSKEVVGKLQRQAGFGYKANGQQIYN
jgi:hypothetical protein